MVSLPRLRQDILDNPVQRVEIKHLLRDRDGLFWNAVYGFSFVLLIAPLLWGFSPHFQRTLEIVVGLLLIMNLTAIIFVETKAINYAVDSIGRELRGKTWELLTLTGVDSSRIIEGKWFGVLKFMLRDFSYLYVLRVGALFWISARTSLIEQGFNPHFQYSFLPVISDVYVSIDSGFLIALVMMGVFIILEGALVTAIGLVTVLFKRTRCHAFGMALFIRILSAIILSLGFTYVIGLWRFYPEPPVRYPYYTHELLNVFAHSFSDNGIVSSFSYSLPEFNPYMGYWSTSSDLMVFTFMGQILGMLPYIFLTIISLFLAKRLAQWQGANEPGFVMKMKPKRVLQPTTKPVSVAQVAIPTPAETTIPNKQPSNPMAKTTPGSDNIFNITTPDQYRCQVHYYHRKLSRLYVSVFKGQSEIPAFYLLFSDVGYLEGPMNWQGANFHIEDKDTCLDLMLKAGLIGEAILQFPDAYASITAYARLYTVQTKDTPVRLIASSASLLREIPSEIG